MSKYFKTNFSENVCYRSLWSENEISITIIKASGSLLAVYTNAVLYHSLINVELKKQKKDLAVAVGTPTLSDPTALTSPTLTFNLWNVTSLLIGIFLSVL